MKARYLASVLVLAAALAVASCTPQKNKLAAICPPTTGAPAATAAASHACTALRTIYRGAAADHAYTATRGTYRRPAAGHAYAAVGGIYRRPQASSDSRYAQSYYDYESDSSVDASSENRRVESARHDYEDDSSGYGQSRRYSAAQGDYSRFSGGVGRTNYDASWVDGYGQIHVYAAGGSSYDNSDTYNGPDYNGYAMYSGTSNRRSDPYNGYNFRTGLSNGY